MNRLRWLTACAAILSAVSAPGQLGVIPNVNLFSEDPSGGRRQEGRWPSESAQQWQKEVEAALAENPHLLVFHDWRQLRGRLEAITPDEVVWRLTDADEPLHFPLAEVRSLRLEGRPDSAARLTDEGPAKAVTATLHFPAADWLFGEVTTADDGNFNMRLDTRGVVHIRRDQVEWIYFGNDPWTAGGVSGSVLDLIGWGPRYHPAELANDTVIVRNGGWTGRSLGTPRRFEVAFELPPDSEEGTHLWLQPYGAQVDVWGQGTTEILFGQKDIAWKNYSEDVVRQTLPKATTAEKGTAVYRIFCNCDDRRVIVLRNGQEVGNWLFSKTPLDIGIRGICFQHDGREGNATLKFSALRLRPWTGIVPTGDAATNDQDQFALGKTVTRGKLESVAKKDFVFSGASHPSQPETFIRLAGAPTALPDPMAKVDLGRQGEFKARKLEIRDGTLRCETALAGSIEMPADGVYIVYFPPSGGPRELSDFLVFKDGDELAGQALSADLNSPIRWKLISGQEVNIQTRRVAGIRLARKATTDGANSSASVELRNGDRLHGDVVALDEKQLHFQHPFLGTLHLDRSQLWQVFPNHSLQPSDGGDGSWTHGLTAEEPTPSGKSNSDFDRWIHLDGTYILRNCESNDYADMSTWEGVHRQVPPDLERFEVRAYATSPEPSTTSVLLRLTSPDSGTGWQASLHQNILQFNVSGPLVRQSTWRRTTIEDSPEVSATCRALRVFVDTKAGTTDFFVNGVLIKHLGEKDEDRLAPGRYTVHVQPNPYEGDPRVLSNLWIGPWTGEIPRADGPTGARTLLSNGDVVAAAPKSLRDGKLAVESDLGALEFPVEKVVELDFDGAPAPERTPGRIRFVDGTTLNVDKFHWSGRELSAHSAIFGNLRLPSNSISELIYDPATVRHPMTPERKKIINRDTGE